MIASAGTNAVLEALVAGLLTWAVTAVGAAVVFTRQAPGTRLLAAMNGFAAGVMLAASYWSLLEPASRIASAGPMPPWVAVPAGFGLGCAFLWGADRLLPHLHPGLARAEGLPTRWRRATLLVLAITLHNVPEGLAIGVAFGAAAAGLPAATHAAAVALAVGIGLQNLPEGVAVAMPLRAQGLSRARSFTLGHLSAAVEPVAAVLGAAAALAWRPLLPYALSFAAGAMIFVIVEQLIPEAQGQGDVDLATASTLAGFGVMTILDLAWA